METYLKAYLVGLAFLTALTTGIGIRAFINWKSPGARTLGLLMFVMSIWAGFYLLEILTPDMQVKLLARKLLYLGMVLSPPFWLGFALRYTGFQPGWFKNGRVLFLAIPGFIAFLLGVTNEFHHLIWKSIQMPVSEPAPLLLEYGPAFWASTAIAYGLILSGFAVYIVKHFRYSKELRPKTGVILIGAALTVFINAAFLFINNDLKIDPTPLSFALAAPMIATGYFRFGVVGLFPLATTMVIDNLKDAVFIVDPKNIITDLNQAAMKLIGIDEIRENLEFFSVLPSADPLKKIWQQPDTSIQLEIRLSSKNRFFETQVMSIYTSDRALLGRVVIFHDVTNEKNLLKAEKRRSQQLLLLEQAGRRIADSFDEREILQRTVDAITHQLGYPETAISLLTEDNMLEIAVIFGTDDFVYQPGYRQELGSGIIGYTANLQKTYVSGNVSDDPHYYSTSTKSGSAICTPIFKQGNLYGVLYVESFEFNAFDELDVITMETLASQVSESLQRATLHAQTKNDLKTLTTIQEVSKLITGSLDIETISQTVVKSLKEAFGYTHVSIYFIQDEYLHLSAQVGYPEEMIIFKIHPSQGIVGRTYRTRSVHFIEDTNLENTFLKADENIVSEICVPLLKDEAVLGVVNIESNQPNRLTQADVDLLTTIAAPIAVAVDNARLLVELKRMATTDAVTSLSNRHVFEQALQAEIERADRNHAPVSLIIFDIDFFKQYNDSMGHPAGDARLKAVADIIKQNLRKYDIAARYGGDEFAIILAECNQQNAMAFAERLCQGTLSGSPEPLIGDSGIPGYTLSLGIATYPQDAITPSQLLLAADTAAMRAKQQGRNRIKIASDHEST